MGNTTNKPSSFVIMLQNTKLNALNQLDAWKIAYLSSKNMQKGAINTQQI